MRIPSNETRKGGRESSEDPVKNMDVDSSVLALTDEGANVGGEVLGAEVLLRDQGRMKDTKGRQSRLDPIQPSTSSASHEASERDTDRVGRLLLP